MKAETANRLTNSLTFAAQGKPQLPAGWVAPNQMESPSQKSNPVLSSIPPDHQSGPNWNRTGRIGRGDRDREVRRASDNGTGGGVEVGGSRKGTGGGDPSSITSNSGAKSEKRDGIRRTHPPPARNCLLASDFQVG